MPVFEDSDLYIAKASDNTAQARFTVGVGAATLRNITIPGGGSAGSMVITDEQNTFTVPQTINSSSAGLEIKRSGTSKVLVSGTGNGSVELVNGGLVALYDTGSGYAASFTPGTYTTARAQSPLDCDGALGLVGNGADGPAAGGIGKVNRTAQSAAVGATNLTNATPSGYYLVHYTIEDTTADVTAGTIQFQINYTDDVGATTQTGAALALTATGRDRGSFQVYLASGNITYQTNLVGIIGTARYALRARCVFLG